MTKRWESMSFRQVETLGNPILRFSSYKVPAVTEILTCPKQLNT